MQKANVIDSLVINLILLHRAAIMRSRYSIRRALYLVKSQRFMPSFITPNYLL